MPQITALTLQKHNPNRLNIYLDGEFAFGVERFAAAWLSIGDEVDREKLQDLLKKDELERAYVRALRFLNIRPRSILEVTTRLQKAGFGEAVIFTTIEHLQSAGLIGDPEFAHTWVENRCNFRPRSKRVLVLELHQKGIADTEIQSAVCNLNESDLAQKTAERYAHRFINLPFDEFRKKMTGYLTRRGFAYGTALETVQKVWQMQHASAETLH